MARAPYGEDEPAGPREHGADSVSPDVHRVVYEGEWDAERPRVVPDWVLRDGCRVGYGVDRALARLRVVPDWVLQWDPFGAARGEVVFSADAAVRAAEAGKQVVLIRPTP